MWLAVIRNYSLNTCFDHMMAAKLSPDTALYNWLCGQPACWADVVIRCEQCPFGQCHREPDYGINDVVMFIKKLSLGKAKDEKGHWVGCAVKKYHSTKSKEVICSETLKKQAASTFFGVSVSQCFTVSVSILKSLILNVIELSVEVLMKVDQFSYDKPHWTCYYIFLH